MYNNLFNSFLEKGGEGALNLINFGINFLGRVNPNIAFGLQLLLFTISCFTFFAIVSITIDAICAVKTIATNIWRIALCAVRRTCELPKKIRGILTGKTELVSVETKQEIEPLAPVSPPGTTVFLVESDMVRFLLEKKNQKQSRLTEHSEEENL